MLPPSLRLAFPSSKIHQTPTSPNYFISRLQACAYPSCLYLIPCILDLHPAKSFCNHYLFLKLCNRRQMRTTLRTRACMYYYVAIHAVQAVITGQYLLCQAAWNLLLKDATATRCRCNNSPLLPADLSPSLVFSGSLRSDGRLTCWAAIFSISTVAIGTILPKLCSFYLSSNHITDGHFVYNHSWSRRRKQ
jgi:hypothetical protein